MKTDSRLTNQPRSPLRWQVGRHATIDAAPSATVPATVPGAVQLDWAEAQNWPPYFVGENFRAYDGLEDSFWTYETILELPETTPGQRLFFVCLGVDYQFDVILGGTVVHRQEGMFTPVEVELTGRARPGDRLQIRIHPAPKCVPSPADRAQASCSCKPAVSYGWDFHPRLIPLGIWDETFVEVRERAFLRSAAADYTLSADLTHVSLWLDAAVDGDAAGCRLRWTVLNPEGAAVLTREAAAGETLRGDIEHPALWWPHDQGTPALHTSRVELLDAADGRVLNVRSAPLGFRRVRLVMAPGQWEFPRTFPKSRSHPPMTLEINGRPIFAKGANWVSPEIFPGLLNGETCREQLALAKAAHMNLLRMWGGAPAQKEAFYDLCDAMGIMVWQEFPLACNLYPDDPAYLRVLDQESRSLITRLKPHPCVVMWCGGNELFNTWSGMTDQSLPLRLLASNCYLLDPARPFLPTSPVDGVGHGHYVFRDMAEGREAWDFFQKASNTAYCEFGCGGPATVETLREIIPAGELFPPARGGVWEAHQAFGVWLESSHLFLDVMEHYFGPPDSLEQMVERGQLLQAEGFRGIYEEARRQKPAASMALCWCLNEPWPTAANNSLLSWPSRPKLALAAVGAACRPLLASARIRQFQWQEGDWFDPELFWLNDAPDTTDPGPVDVRVETPSGKWHLLRWDGGPLPANTNLAGPQVRWTLPDLGTERFELILDTPSRPEAASRYTLLFRAKVARVAGGTAVMNL